MPTRAATTSEISIGEIRTQTVTIGVRGVRPLILNRLAEKARHELLMPTGRKTAADKASNLKHDPYAEFRASPYTFAEDDAPTLLAVPASAFKGAMMTAALDLPGAKKAQIGRLVWVEDDLVPIFGVPEIFLSVTRSADMNKTPDIRSRAIVRHWAAAVTVTFTVPLINEKSVLNLLGAAGKICGVGDWRTEKGKGTFGAFAICNDDDELFRELTTSAGREAQAAAMNDPVAYDRESAELLDWFEDEVSNRGRTATIRKIA